MNTERLRREFYFATMPMHAWMLRGRKIRALHKELKTSEFLSNADLRNLQESRLNALLKHAAESSPFYRQRLHKLGVSISDLAGFKTLETLPLLEKSDVRENLLTGLVSNRFELDELLKITTSGSTGEPFTIYANQSQLEIRFASTLRALESTGWQFGESQVRLWHQTLGMTRSQVIRERIDATLLSRTFIPAFEFSPSSIRSFVARIERVEPVLIDGYAESLNFLASYLNSGGQIDIRPRAVMSSAQMLPRQTKLAVENALRTKVFDKYGSREFSGIAYECSYQTGHHVVDECYIVELLVDGRPAQPGEIGEVVITDLFNYATPLIRYRIGDLAVALDNSVVCPCGRGHSRIGEIQGRTQAIVHCANGTWMPGTFFAHFFKDHESTIRFFQILQSERGRFDLLVVPGTEFNARKLDEVLEQLREYVGNTSINLRLVDSIPLVRTGKRSPVVSQLSVDFQDLPGIFNSDGR